MMQESAIYQDILEKGQQKEGRSFVLRYSPNTLRPRIETLSLEQLEILGEALLDLEANHAVSAKQHADLEAWFRALE